MTPHEYQATVAGGVRAEMARKRATPAELAAVLGTTPATAARRLNGSYPFSVYEIALVGAWLGVNPEQFGQSITAVSA